MLLTEKLWMDAKTITDIHGSDGRYMQALDHSKLQHMTGVAY